MDSAYPVKISVIMSAYNHEKFVAEAINSILNQDWQDFEFIIRDDGSSDGTAGIISSYTDNRIRFLGTGVNQGLAESRNMCIRQARGEYIALINSDDLALPQRLSTQLKYLEAAPDIGACFTRVQLISEEGDDIYESSPNTFNLFENRHRHEWLKHFFEIGNCLCHPSVLIRAKCYHDAGTYQPLMRQLADLHLWVRLCARYAIHIIDERLVKFRVMNDQQNTSYHPRARELSPYENIDVLNLFCTDILIEQLHAIFPQKILQQDTPVQRLKKLALHALSIESPTSHFFALNCLRRIPQLPGWGKETNHGHLLDIGKDARPTFAPKLIDHIESLDKTIQTMVREAQKLNRDNETISQESHRMRTELALAWAEHDNVRQERDSILHQKSLLKKQFELLENGQNDLQVELKSLQVKEQKQKTKFLNKIDALKSELMSSKERQKKTQNEVNKWNNSSWFKRAFHKLRIHHRS